MLKTFQNNNSLSLVCMKSKLTILTSFKICKFCLFQTISICKEGTSQKSNILKPRLISHMTNAIVYTKKFTIEKNPIVVQFLNLLTNLLESILQFTLANIIVHCNVFHSIHVFIVKKIFYLLFYFKATSKECAAHAHIKRSAVKAEGRRFRSTRMISFTYKIHS